MIHISEIKNTSINQNIRIYYTNSWLSHNGYINIWSLYYEICNSYIDICNYYMSYDDEDGIVESRAECLSRLHNLLISESKN